MPGAIGGVGGIGGMGGMGAVGGVAAAPAAAPAASVGNASAAGTSAQTQAASNAAPQASTKVTISQAAVKAMSTDNQQVGASFSVTTDASGHHYVGGTDANGFSNPDVKATQQVNGAHADVKVSLEISDPNLNAFGQNLAELNKMDDLVAALILALLLQKQDDKG